MSSERRGSGGSFRNLDELLHRLGGEPVTMKIRADRRADADEAEAGACKAFLLNEHLAGAARDTRR